MSKIFTITDLKILEFNVVIDGTDYILTSTYSLITDTGLVLPAVRKSVKWKDIPHEQKQAINQQIKDCKNFSDLMDVAKNYIKTIEEI